MNLKDKKQEIITRLKSEGRERDIHEALRGIKNPKISKQLAYLEGDSFNDYMKDMKIAQ